jgi:hypothetical protein
MYGNDLQDRRWSIIPLRRSRALATPLSITSKLGVFPDRRARAGNLRLTSLGQPPCKQLKAY